MNFTVDNTLEATKKVFKLLIEAIKEKFNYVIKRKIKISLLELKEKIKELERTIEEYAKIFECETEIKIYSREEIHDMYYEHDDIYLALMD